MTSLQWVQSLCLPCVALGKSWIGLKMNGYDSVMCITYLFARNIVRHIRHSAGWISIMLVVRLVCLPPYAMVSDCAGLWNRWCEATFPVVCVWVIMGVGGCTFQQTYSTDGGEYGVLSTGWCHRNSASVDCQVLVGRQAIARRVLRKMWLHTAMHSLVLQHAALWWWIIELLSSHVVWVLHDTQQREPGSYFHCLTPRNWSVALPIFA